MVAFISACKAGSHLYRGGPGLLKHSLRGCRGHFLEASEHPFCSSYQKHTGWLSPYPLYDLEGIDVSHNYEGVGHD